MNRLQDRSLEHASAATLSGGNGWDTAALLRAAAELARAGDTCPLAAASSCEGGGYHEVALARECIRRWGADKRTGDFDAGRYAEVLDRAADGLDAAQLDPAEDA